MKFQTTLAVTPDELFDRLMASVAWDWEEATGKKRSAANVRQGTSYRKSLRTKMGGQQSVRVSVTGLERPHDGRAIYEARFEAPGTVNTIRYELVALAGEAPGTQVSYEERCETTGGWGRANAAVTGFLYGRRAQKRVRQGLQQMEGWILANRDSHQPGQEDL